MTVRENLLPEEDISEIDSPPVVKELELELESIKQNLACKKMEKQG